MKNKSKKKKMGFATKISLIFMLLTLTAPAGAFSIAYLAAVILPEQSAQGYGWLFVFALVASFLFIPLSIIFFIVCLILDRQKNSTN